MDTRSWGRHAVVALVLGLGACRAPADEEEHGHEAHENEHVDPHAAHAESTLRVEPGMLRDLRMSIRKAEKRPLGEAVTALGDLRINEETYAEVGSPIAARVTKVHAAPGDAVKANQALVELTSVAAGAVRAEASVSASKLALARERLARLKELASHQIVPGNELATAEAEVREAEASGAAASEAVSALGAVGGTGARLTLRSPIAGTVLERNALLGRLVDAELPLFIVGDLKRLWLVVHAFERDALRIRTGATARVSFPALPGQDFEGKVTRVGSRVDPSSRTLDVRVELDNPEGVLRPGMSGSASVPVGDENTQIVTVPVAAIQRIGDDWGVFIPEREPGHFELRPVGRGRELAGEVEILRGLSAGESVVVDGAFLLKAEADKARGGGAEHHH